MELRNLALAAALLAGLALNARAQDKPGASDPTLTAAKAQLKQDKEKLQADKAALQANREKTKSDRAALQADREKLRAARERRRAAKQAAKKDIAASRDKPANAN